ncbi:MAG: c-type cytochrome [Candidatus Glassbacteria bacterium]
MNRLSATAIETVTLLLLTSSILNPWPWSKDMNNQPSMDPYERYGNPPEWSIPLSSAGTGIESREEAGKLENPVGPDELSVKSGERLFGIFCQVCHGSEGGGMGPVSMKFIPAPDIRSDYYRNLPDGHFYYVIKRGGAIMPSYGESLGESDIWDIVNFVRELQRGDRDAE